VELYDEAIAIFRTLHDDWSVAQCLVYCARFLTSRDAERARVLILEAIDIVRPIGERNTTGMALATLANLTLDAHDDLAARRLVEESLALSDELNDLFNSSQRLGTLAQMAMDDMRFADAVDLLERCATRFRLLGNRHRLAHARHDLAFAARMAGDADRALHSFQECRALFEELGLHAEAAAVRASLGHLQRQQDPPAVAAATFQTSWLLLTTQAVELGIPTVLAGLGELALDANRVSEAVGLLGAAEALMERLQVGPQGILNTTRPSLRGYQLRRDAAHVRELRANVQRAFSNLSDNFADAHNAGRALTTAQACAFGLESVSAYRPA
jgi:tetratricopeptide (TPR) repeat protein